MSRILIVEDDLEFRTLLETMIRLEGHEVHLASNGETGFTQARNKKPDIILTDIEMPGMSGIDLIRAVRAHGEIGQTYVILITGAAAEQYKLDALRAGADDFLEKPSSRVEILGRLEIAQKVMAVQGQLRESEARAATLQEAPQRISGELDLLEKALAAVQSAIAKKDAANLVAAVKKAKEALERARAACGGAAPAGDSWL